MMGILFLKSNLMVFEVDHEVIGWSRESEGFVVINSEGIPTKWHESMPYERPAVVSQSHKSWEGGDLCGAHVRVHLRVLRALK